MPAKLKRQPGFLPPKHPLQPGLIARGRAQVRSPQRTLPHRVRLGRWRPEAAQAEAGLSSLVEGS